MYKREINELNTVLELRCCINFGKYVYLKITIRAIQRESVLHLPIFFRNPETLAAVSGWTASSCLGRFTNPILRDGLNGENT